VNNANKTGVETLSEPKTLYRYYAFNEHTEKIFKENEIYFASPDQYADLSDSKICWVCEGTYQEKEIYLNNLYLKKCPDWSEEKRVSFIKKLLTDKDHGDDFQQIIKGSGERIRRRLGIYCLTEKKDNILMWVHYAYRHSGFCLEFDINNGFFGLYTRAIKVEYETKLPIINVLHLENVPKGELGTKLVIKATDWKYEQEWRIVDTKGSGIHHFPEEALIGVILGNKISPKNKENVLKWCKLRKYPPTIYEAKEKEKEFGLDIVKIDY